MLDTGGHHAPVRRLVFTSDESRLLSAGDDKVVRVWDLDARPKGLAWTIRPRIWRGFAGAINAMALTTPDAQGQQTLALGGFGVESTRGEIGLYRFPGAVDRRQGDVEAYLPSGDLSKRLADPGGHLDAVSCLAFDPKGEILASSSIDQTARLWNYRTQAPLAVLTALRPGKTERIGVHARWPQARGDGRFRWLAADLERGLPSLPCSEAVAPPPSQAWDARAISPRSRSMPSESAPVAVGSSSAEKTGGSNPLRLDSRPISPGAYLFLKTNDQQGPVEGLVAFGPANVLATSIVHPERARRPLYRQSPAASRPTRSTIPRANPRAIATTSNLVYALAFSPKGKYLAFAGGDRQDVTLIELKPLNSMPSH